MKIKIFVLGVQILLENGKYWLKKIFFLNHKKNLYFFSIICSHVCKFSLVSHTSIV